ncbi:MAG: hypothetical protein K0S41_2348 [Anaerocolumna sp.]|jgi:hypothetical protein|nr:hypothetical protein [Anaerocolumna sp.]
MIKSTKTTMEILQNILSHDTHKVWEASCNIISLGQDNERMKEFIPYLEDIRTNTRGLNMGGLIVPNQRFIDKAIEIIEFYKKDTGCSCCLLGEDSNPSHEEKNGNMIIQDIIHIENSNYIDYYIVNCMKCNKKYKVFEREYHYLWWEWIPIN